MRLRAHHMIELITCLSSVFQDYRVEQQKKSDSQKSLAAMEDPAQREALAIKAADIFRQVRIVNLSRGSVVGGSY